MAAIPNWLLGKHQTDVRIVAQAVAIDGTLTPGAGAEDTAVLLSSTGTTAANSIVHDAGGRIDEVRLVRRRTSENIKASHRPFAHNVRVTYGHDLELVEVLQQGANARYLERVFHNGEGTVVSFVFGRGGNKFVGFGVIKSYTTSLQRGKNTGRLVLGPVDAGATDSFSYADGDR